jgi:hypothetical protein
LHDVVEDCPDWSFERLRAEGFSDEVIRALDGVTRREGETYDAFIARSAENQISRAVKIADLLDNSDLSRIASPTDADHERIARYKRALAQLRP